jgi:Ca2+-dependent lipid-binding protein
MNRFYRNARSDIKQEFAKERLETDAETTDWINEFMRRFWLIFEPVLSATIVQQVDAVLAAQCPSFLDSIRLTTFTLGTKPPMILSVKSYPKVDDDVVVRLFSLINAALCVGIYSTRSNETRNCRASMNVQNKST